MKIAIVRRNGLGDLLCAYPLILYLQQCYPSASITLFVDARNAPLVRYLPPVDEVVVFPKKGPKYWNLFRTARRYKNQFDLAISAKTSPMKLTNLFLYWLKAKERLAYTDDSWHRLLINRPTPYVESEANNMHQALKGLKLVAPNLNEVPEELYPKITVPEDLKERYPLPLSSQDPLVLVSATTTKPASRFDAERYSALLNRLHASSPISVLIIGQEDDRFRAEAIASGLQMQSYMHFPRNFDEFMVLLDQSDLFFVGDGGIAHIGAALGKRQVALFGETNPIEWRPLSKQAETFYHPLHVDCLSDQAIFQALERQATNIREHCGRNHL